MYAKVLLVLYKSYCNEKIQEDESNKNEENITKYNFYDNALNIDSIYKVPNEFEAHHEMELDKYLQYPKALKNTDI